jgi:DNA-binding transcriptional MerR regulator
MPADTKETLLPAEWWGKRIYSHADALYIAQVSTDTLLTWHKRGIMPDASRDVQARGHRRKYSAHDLAYLLLLKAVAGAGWQLTSAQTYVKRARFSFRKIVEFARRRPAETLERPHRPLLVLLPIGKASIFNLQETFPDDMSRWMRKKRTASVTIIDIDALAREFYRRVREVKAREGESSQQPAH